MPRKDKGTPHIRSYKSLLPPNKKVPASPRQIELKLKKVKIDVKHCRKNAGDPHDLVCKIDDRYDFKCQSSWRILVCSHCGWLADSYTPIFCRTETKWKPIWVKDAPTIKDATVIEVATLEQAVG